MQRDRAGNCLGPCSPLPSACCSAALPSGQSLFSHQFYKVWVPGRAGCLVLCVLSFQTEGAELCPGASPPTLSMAWVFVGWEREDPDGDVQDSLGHPASTNVSHHLSSENSDKATHFFLLGKEGRPCSFGPPVLAWLSHSLCVEHLVSARRGAGHRGKWLLSRL